MSILILLVLSAAPPLGNGSLADVRPPEQVDIMAARREAARAERAAVLAERRARAIANRPYYRARSRASYAAAIGSQAAYARTAYDRHDAMRAYAVAQLTGVYHRPEPPSCWKRRGY